MKPRILIAEDSATQREMLKSVLEQNGYRVVAVCNGKEAMKAVESFSLDVAISDVVMPEMDGFELCGEIRKKFSSRELPVILLTSLSNPADVVKGLQCGADNFIVKPYNRNYLLNRLKLTLMNKEVRRLQRTEFGIEILFAGKAYLITSDKQQILDMLLTTYEMAVMKNNELEKVQDELKHLNANLEEKVAERTKALAAESAQRHKAEERFRQAQKMEAIGLLAGGVAHDFNNLLNVIIGYSELLMVRMGQEDPARIDVAEILFAGTKAADLTRQLLAFSRKQVLQPQTVDLNSLVRDIGKMLARLIGEDMELLPRLSASIGMVRVDPGQMEQVIMNLVVNARDAMPHGGKILIETANVRFEAEHHSGKVAMPRGNYVMLAITDNGSGMSKEVQEHLFEPFFTTKTIGKGTGLGLSTVYGIVKQSEGYIFAYSEIDKGTTFKIYFPECADEAMKDSEKELTRTLPRGAETILLVEDEKNLQLLASKILETQGYRIITARNGHDAIRIAGEQASPIQLLITDVVMPGINGSETAQKIKQLRPDIRVLFISGYTDTAAVELNLVARGVKYLQKPFTIQALTKMVREVLDENQ